MREICPVTNKIKYSQKDAGDIVRNAKSSSRKKRVPLRAYYCRSCGAYHLTHFKARYKPRHDSTFKNKHYYFEGDTEE